MLTYGDRKTSLETVTGEKGQIGNKIKSGVQCGQGDVCTGSEITRTSLSVGSPDKEVAGGSAWTRLDCDLVYHVKVN